MNSILDSFDQAAAAAPAAPASAPGSLASAFDQASAAVSKKPTADAATKPKSVSSTFGAETDTNAALGGAIIHGATALAGGVIGGFHGLGTLLTGGSVNDAVKNIHDDEDALTYNPPSDSDAATLSRVATSKYSPLMIPAHVGNAVGDGINSLPNKVGGYDISAPKAALAAGTDAAIQVLGPGAVMKGVRPIRSLLDAPTRIQPADMAQTAQAGTLRNNASPTLNQAAPTPQPVGAQSAAASPAVPDTAVTPAASSGPSAANSAPVSAPTIAEASPALQQAVSQAQAKGVPLNPQVVARHVDAETLPVPVQLTEGQATLDPATISNEMNSRGKSGPLVSPDFYNQQGKALAQNLDAIRSQVAPDVAASNPLDHGQVLVDQYKAMDAPVVADIAAKYKALEDANGGQFPLDGQALAANTQTALDKALKSSSVPADLQANLDKFANGRQMTFQDFETMRSDAADAQRTATDGRQRAAAAIVRQQLEAMPLTPEAANLKPLADQARSAAKARFDAMDADPAYAAAVGDGVKEGEASPLADKFVQKYVIGAPRANVLQMRQNLAGSQLAQQTIPAATLDYLRGAAKADVETGQFNQASYNGVVNKLAPKFDAVLDPKSAQQVQQVGRVAKYTTVQPKGSFVNNSNTLVGAAGQVGLQFAKDALAVKTFGASKVVGGIINSVKTGSAAKAATAPGAGITKLSDLLPPKD